MTQRSGKRAPMNGLAIPFAMMALMLAAACGGGSSDDQPEVIGTSTRSATASGSRTATQSGSRTPTATLMASSTSAATASAAATAPPATSQLTDAPQPTSAPTAQPPANGNPSFPQQFLTAQETNYEYDENGVLTGAVTTMTVPSASDPDGDPLTYSWAASNGSVSGNGTSGTWDRLIEGGQEAPGAVTVTASDGRGGAATFTVDFQ